jgi:hypothetical protein
MPLGLHGSHAAFLNAVIRIIETTGILDQTKIAVFAGAETAAANKRPMTGNRCKRNVGEASKLIQPSAQDWPQPY